MSDKVQTGVRIDSALLQKAREHAKERGWNLSVLFEEALRAFLGVGSSVETPSKKKPKLMRAGGKGTKPVYDGPVVVTKPDGSIDKIATQRAQRERVLGSLAKK